MNLSRRLLKLIPRMTAICKKACGWPDFQENTADITRSHDLHLWDPQHSPADEHHRRRCDWLNAFSRALAENSPAYITLCWMLLVICSHSNSCGNFIKISNYFNTALVSVFYKILELLCQCSPGFVRTSVDRRRKKQYFCGCRRHLICPSEVPVVEMTPWLLTISHVSTEVILFLFCSRIP